MFFLLYATLLNLKFYLQKSRTNFKILYVTKERLIKGETVLLFSLGRCKKFPKTYKLTLEMSYTSLYQLKVLKF